jgi:hypothetical protein
MDSEAELRPFDLKRNGQYKPKNLDKLSPEEKLKQERRKRHQERRGISLGPSTPRGIQRESSIISEPSPSSPSPLTTTPTPSISKMSGKEEIPQTPPIQHNYFTISLNDLQRMITEISTRLIQNQTTTTTASTAGIANIAVKFPLQLLFSGKPDQLEPTI